MALRRADGFRRYALSIQYHGASFLGFSYQGPMQEDCIVAHHQSHHQEKKKQTVLSDLRGYRSVEGRLREALDALFPPYSTAPSSHDPCSRWENIQVSSRTDRGVHALHNTIHVDIRQAEEGESGEHEHQQQQQKMVNKLYKGLNFHLGQQLTYWERQANTMNSSSAFSVYGNKSNWKRSSMTNDLRILSAAVAPDTMVNPYASTVDGIKQRQPDRVDWNVRFSATQRNYLYRILHFCNSHPAANHPKTVPEHETTDGHPATIRSCQSNANWGIPFEWDRSWQIRSPRPLLVQAMQQSSQSLLGCHDFTSFRGARCQRQSPIVTLESIRIHSQHYVSGIEQPFGVLTESNHPADDNHDNIVTSPTLVTIQFIGNAFLYRQVRNMVGCLVQVGLGKLPPEQVSDILHAKNRSVAPAMAPPHGLFLTKVEHCDFVF